MAGFSKLRKSVIVAAALGTFLSLPSYAQRIGAAAASDPTKEDYAAAAKLLAPNVAGLVRNEAVAPHWIGQSGQFWYKRDGEDGGPEFVIVNTKGAKTPAFDHEALARALSAATGQPRSGKGLPANVALSDDLKTLTATLGGKAVRCDIKAQQCSLSNAAGGRPNGARGGDRQNELLSPDGRQVVLMRDNNLYLRDVATGQERPLTTDGTALLAWSNEPFYSNFLTFSQVRAGVTRIFQTAWSPDSRYLIAPLVDVRGVGTYPYVEWAPVDGSKRPIVHNIPMPMPGDRETLKITYYIFDLSSGRRTAIELPAGYPEWSWPPRWNPVVGWSQRRGQAFIQARTNGWKKGAMLRVDLATGKSTTVIEDTSPTRVEFHEAWGPSNNRVLGDGDEIIWYSDRSGWGQLYLYDAQTGRLKNAITKGDWAVDDVMAIDEPRREVYVTGTGREPGQDPYYRNLYRARLDGTGDLVRLTSVDADHNTGGVRSPNNQPGSAPNINLSANVFVDTWSTVDKPPVTELRSTRDGHLIAQLERADASRLFAAGWVPPVRERYKADDGMTDIYADYWAPSSMAPGQKYPVIDNPYNGASSLRTPRNFTEAYRTSASTGAAGLTHLGFGLVIVDGRGTNARSRAFRDAGYPAFTQIGVNDHVAAIRQMAVRHPEMDLDRVGVYGQSWGGQFAAAAILSKPEFYKVAIASAGVYDYAAMEKGYDEYIGEPIYADGSHYRTRPNEIPTNWGGDISPVLLADRLQGHLMITYGDLDEEARPDQVAQLVEALIKANKPYDLLYIPNGEHSAYFTSYGFKRGWDYFIEHLRGAKPVRDFNIGLPGGIRG